MIIHLMFFFFFKQKTAYEMRISDWSSDVCSSDLLAALLAWVAAPLAPLTGMALGLAGLVHLARMARWAGDRTLGEPLVLVLHLGYVASVHCRDTDSR